MTTDPVQQLRAICLAFPETAGKEARADLIFRVRDRIFAVPKKGDGRLSVRLEAPPGSREIRIDAAPETFLRPPHVGYEGRVGVRLDNGPDRSEVETLVERSYRLVAPKHLVARIARLKGSG